MKTSEYKAKPQPHASRTQEPFFNPNRQATFFSGGSVQREPFFNPSRVVPAIQAKLTVGAVGDRYEQEADHVAANVVAQINDSSAQVSGEQASVQRMGEKEENMQMKPIAEKIQRMGMEEEENLQMKPMFETVQRMGEEEEDLQMKPAAEKIQRMGGMEEEDDLQMKPTLQRIGHEGGAVSTDLEAEIQSARGSGQALAPDLQAQMGQAMGADFSGVRVHTNAQSDRLNQSIQAKAFTTGQDMFFRQGTYEPGSREGQELIAHELTHVVQQTGRAMRLASDYSSAKNHGGDLIQRRMPDKDYLQNISNNEDQEIQDVELSAAIRALKLALRANGDLNAAKSVDEDVKQEHTARQGDDPKSAVKRVIAYLISTAEDYSLFLAGAAASNLRQQPDASERVRLGYAVHVATQILSEIGQGFSGEANGDPVENVFGKEGVDIARPIFTQAAKGLQRFYDNNLIWKRRQGAPGLTSTSNMTLSLDVIAALENHPSEWNPVQKTLCHEAFHIVDQKIQDRGGYRPAAAAEYFSFFARPLSTKLRSAPHFEEVVWQYTGEGPTRQKGIGGSIGPRLLTNAQDLVQGAWWASLDATAALVNAQQPNATQEHKKLAIWYSQAEGLTLHERYQYLYKKQSWYNWSDQKLLANLRITDIDIALTETITAQLSKAYGKTLSFKLIDDVDGYLALTDPVKCVQILLKKAVEPVSPIKASLDEDINMVIELAKTKGYKL